jgi:hypothetical protein
MDNDKVNKIRRGKPYAGAVISRYVDAYRIAGITVGFGTGIKVAGGALGLAMLFLRLGELGFVLAVLVAAVFFSFGVLLAAHGQVLSATLDTAVASSPFLTDEQRAIAMSLRNLRPTPDEGYDEPTRPSAEPTEVGGFCFHCGCEVTEGATECQHCGKTL